MERDTHQVQTADNVGIGYEPAGIASRFVALALDTLLQAAIISLLAILFAALAGSASATVIGLVVLVFIPFFVVVGYYVVTETAGAGRTPGKRAAHIRVIRLDGSAPGLGEALVRNIVRIVDMLGVGVVAMFVSPQARRLGDLAAGTVVVRERRVTAPLPGVPVLLRTPDAGPPVDGLERLGTQEYTAVRAFLSRPGLHPEQRRRLAEQIAARLLDRLDLPADAPERAWPAELFLERLYLQLADRLERR